MKMRSIVKLSLLVFFMLFMCGCGRKNDLFKKADIDNGGLYFYSYDIETKEGYLYSIYDEDGIKEIVDDLSAVAIKEAENWTHDKLTDSIYGIKIAGIDEWFLNLAWCNNYCISENGEIYSFEYDFEKFLTDYNWNSQTTFTGSTFLPCARVLSESEDGWEQEMLTPAEELTSPKDISMSLTGHDENGLTVEITNTGTKEWAYGTGYSVQVLLEGVWYDIPTIPGRWEFPAIAIILPAGETQTENYDLEMYGKLPTGTYRLMVDGVAVEFEITTK